MEKCITVKGKQFEHQFLYTGNADERRCHFCQLTVPNLPEEEKIIPRQWNVQLVVSDDNDQYDSEYILSLLEFVLYGQDGIDIEILNIQEVKIK